MCSPTWFCPLPCARAGRGSLGKEQPGQGAQGWVYGLGRLKSVLLGYDPVLIYYCFSAVCGRGYSAGFFTLRTMTLRFAGSAGEKTLVLLNMSILNSGCVGEANVGCWRGWNTHTLYQDTLILRWHQPQQQVRYKASKTHGIL